MFLEANTANPNIVLPGPVPTRPFVQVAIGNTSIDSKKIAACRFKKEGEPATIEDVYESLLQVKFLRACPILDENSQIFKNAKLFGKVFGEHHVLEWHYIFRGKNCIRCWFLTREDELRSYFLMLTEKISDDKITVVWA